jgi:tol-pal system protein YbgF
MKRYGSLTLVLLAAACPLLAQNQKEITLAIQRDLSNLREKIDKLQTDQDAKFQTLADSLRGTSDALARLNEKLAVIQSTTAEKLGDVTRQVGAPTQALSQKVDGMNDQFLNLSNTVAELNSRIGKLDAKLEDVKKMLQTIPPAPQPSQPQAANGGGTPMVSGEKLFDDANRDYLAGNADLALQGFNEYLKNFADTQRAPDAQFFIGEIYSRKEDFDSAVKGYDAVITNYPDSSRVPNAHYMKGVALVKTGRRADAAKEFKIVVDKYPSNELAKKAKDYLKILGVPISQAPAQKKTTKRR